MKKGFTLIELLAVIVVLAIISLIATPIVLNIIENSQTVADERSLEQYAKVMQTAYYEMKMDDIFLTLEDYLKLVDTDAGVSLIYNGSKVECDEKKPVKNEDGTEAIELYSCKVDGRGYYQYVDGKASKEKSVFTITNNLIGALNNNELTTIKEGDSYSATITPNDGYEIETISIIMGEKDITSTAYDNGVITISKVTGNIVIDVNTVDKFDKNGDGLPDEYIKLNYIESDGKQGLNLETAFDGKSDYIKMKIYTTKENVTSTLFSSGKYVNDTFCNVQFTKYNAIAGYDGRNPSYSFNVSISNSIYLNEHEIVIQDGKLYLNDKLIYTFTVTNSDASDPLYLFCEAGNYCAYARLYEADMVIAGVEYHLKPAQRKTDGVNGMFDTVSKRFYESCTDYGFMGG